MKEMKNLVGRAKSGHQGETPVKGKVMKSGATDMKGTRVKKGSEMKRVNEPEHKFGHMGLKIGSRVTSREVGGKR